MTALHFLYNRDILELPVIVMRQSYFSRETAAALKGIALILMFIHHFFTFPDWIVCGVEYPWAQTFADLFCEPTKICVGLFAFLTGYFFAFSKGTLRYSLGKITDFLLSYWVVCVPLLAVALLTGWGKLSRSGALLELLGLKSRVMIFCWYVYFYCIILVMLAVLTRLGDLPPAMEALVLLGIPSILFGIWALLDIHPVLRAVCENLRLWYPCVAVGWLFARHGLFTRWLEPFTGRSGVLCRIAVPAGMVLLAVLGRYCISGLTLGFVIFRSGEYPLKLTADVLYAPLFLFGGAKLLTLRPGSPVVRVLEAIGKRSMLMWFYHCVFFDCFKRVTQPVLYFPRNPVLVLLNGLLLCYLAAVLTQPVCNLVIGWKNRLAACFTRQGVK